MSRFISPAKWISVQVDRFLHTNPTCSFIYPGHVRNQNWVGAKTPAQEPAQNDQRSQFGDRNSVLNSSHLARQSAAEGYCQSSKACRLFWYYIESTFVRSARHPRRKSGGTNVEQIQRLLQRNFRDYYQASRIALKFGMKGRLHGSHQSIRPTLNNF